jgi:hypothetical protein
MTIITQGSEPTSIQRFLENLFDAINKLQFDKVANSHDQQHRL